MRELMEFVNYHLQFTKVKFNFLKKKKEQLLNERDHGRLSRDQVSSSSGIVQYVN